MENIAIKTLYGTMHGRDALILKDVKLNMYPMEIEIIVSLDLSFCKPIINESKEVLVNFKLSKIKSLSIKMIDSSDYQLLKKSSFDEIINNENNYHHYILSTYDHVFDIIGDCEVLYN